MRLAIVGGAGVRTPLLVHGLTRSDLPIEQLRLFDIDRARLALMAPLAQHLSSGASVVPCDSIAEAVAGADYVFTSIRVGGIEGRARDEGIALAHGIVGQETVGPGGFAMAMRTIPPLVAHVRAIQRHAPRAWIVNFTNPVGIITQAVHAATAARIIGICDTPAELFAEIAHALDLPSGECHFDYFGLNHLGWVREVYYRGEPQLPGLWSDRARLAALYRPPLFPPDLLAKLRLLPTEYVYYYYRSRDAFENVRRAGRSRGAVIQELNEALFDDLRRGVNDPAAVYEAYLAARDAGYMQIESGSAAPRRTSPWAEPTGYDKIALAVVRAIHFNTNAIIPLNVPNRGTIPELDTQDVVEVPCVVNSNGAHPLHVGSVPSSVRDLLIRVKAYERLTVAAARSGDRAAAEAALAANPLVADAPLASKLWGALTAL